MKPCPDAGRLQDFIDRELSENDARSVRDHLAECAHCAAELTLYRRAFECLDRLPEVARVPDLTERILDRVVPARIRRRWIRTVGWAYAAALAACVVATTVLVSQPAARAWMSAASSEASRRFVHTVVFTLDMLAFTVLHLATGWGILTAAGERLAPLGRAFATLCSNPLILVALGAATLSCMALLWWLRPRDRKATREIRHVGVLGF